MNSRKRNARTTPTTSSPKTPTRRRQGADDNPRPSKRAKTSAEPLYASSPLTPVRSSSRSPPRTRRTPKSTASSRSSPLKQQPIFSSPLTPLSSQSQPRSSAPSPVPRTLEGPSATDHNLLLALPSIVIHPPNHPLYAKSLYISLHAAKKCVEAPALEPDVECRAWTNLAEVGMLVIETGLAGYGSSKEAQGSSGEEWAQGIESEVEKAASKALMIAQKHPALRGHRTRLTLLSAKLASWQQNHKFALNLLRRHIGTLLPSDPTHVVYTAHIAYILEYTLFSNAPHAGGGERAVKTALDAIDTLQALATKNGDVNVVMHTRYTRLRTLVEKGMWGNVVDTLKDAEMQEELGLLQLHSSAANPDPSQNPSTQSMTADSQPTQPTPDTTTVLPPAPFADQTNTSSQCQDRPRTKSQEFKVSQNQNTRPDSAPIISHPPATTVVQKLPRFSLPFHQTMAIHILILGVVYYTHIGDSKEATARLGILHAIMDSIAKDLSGDGYLELPLRSSPNDALRVQCTHPKALYALAFLVTATAKRDAVGRKPKRRLFAEEGLRFIEREFEKGGSVEFQKWAGFGDVQEYEGRMVRIKADLMCEIIGILILRSEFSLARTKLDELIAHLRNYDLWDPSSTGGGMYAARVCLHQGHLAQATGGLTKAVQCYRVCAWIASGRKEAHDAGKKPTPVMKDQFLYIAARACDVGLRLGMLRGGRSFARNPDEEDVDEDMTEDEVRRLASSVAKECRGMGSMLESVGQVIEACLSTEIVKAKHHLKQALSLCTKSQDNYMRAIVIALISSHYFHTQVKHACDMLGAADNLAAGLGASSTKAVSGGSESLGHTTLRLWISERLLELYKRTMADNEELIRKQEAMVTRLRVAVYGVDPSLREGGRQSQTKGG